MVFSILARVSRASLRAKATPDNDPDIICQMNARLVRMIFPTRKPGAGLTGQPVRKSYS